MKTATDQHERRACAIVTSLGRPEDFSRLLRSLDAQTVQDFRLIIVDQSDDGALRALAEDHAHGFELTYVGRPGERGASRGRNVGLALADTEFVVFPDDDCWYPPEFLHRAIEGLAATDAAALSGRPVDADGRTINGRFEDVACRVDRANVWTTQIEWLILYRRTALQAVGGFDEELGVGAATRWQSCEAQDTILKLLKAGRAVLYDPSLTGHHDELDVVDPDPAMRRKGRAYARGMGRALALHGYGPLSAAKWVSRPLARAGLCAARLRFNQARYNVGVAAGRLEGYAARRA